MTTAVQNFLRSYELLPDFEKQMLAYEILRRSMKFNPPPISDEELILNAEGLFLELDQRESDNDGPSSRRSMVS